MKTTKTGQRGFTGYVLLFALAVGGLGVLGALTWDKGRLQAARKAGYDQAQAEAKAATTAAENRSLLLQREQIINLSNDLSEARNAYTVVAKSLNSSRSAADRSGQRVRSATPAGGELDQRLAAAECPVVRTFAARSFRAATACRDAVADLGLGAGGLVEAAASAHYEHARADALIRFSMPRSPFTKPVEK